MEKIVVIDPSQALCKAAFEGLKRKTMKYKNYKSAIHNFTHSFISVDYTRSGCLAVNVLIDLYNLGLDTKSTFDFISKTILPRQAESEESNQLLNDYLEWLLDHFESHNCDLSQLEILEVSIWTDFDRAIFPTGMNDTGEFKINALTKWKPHGREEETIEISQIELIKKDFLKLRIPEMKYRG
ncbi:hypothetical protein J0A68_05705 [Algoriphagus sp. H41]|uniref:Uncharacterized protein n=1 Tax=Algoriphagus oliviformis TaxID=2811231 RepID=A0ABS3C008_9BACT|nr:hypothetical protein [Algoriphagus oliviformis]MBN7810440.1 hypothetical protein [Algoriphagus oliviformis]